MIFNEKMYVFDKFMYKNTANMVFCSWGVLKIRSIWGSGQQTAGGPSGRPTAEGGRRPLGPIGSSGRRAAQADGGGRPPPARADP